jgi:hypothetical protein
MHHMLKTAVSLAVAAFLVGVSPAMAQVELAENIQTGLSELGIATDGLVLTEEQVAQIENVLNDASMDAAGKTAEINAIIGN